MPEHLYLERNNSCCEMDNAELDNFNSDEEEPNDFMSKYQEKKHAKRKIYQQEVDTNVYRIQLSCLKDAASMATGDPETCTKCQAVFNMHSKLEEVKQMDGSVQQSWKCEFCCTVNDVCLDEEEIPKESAVNFLVEAAAQVQDKKIAG